MKIDAYGNIKPAGIARKRGSTSSVGDFSSILEAAEINENSSINKLGEIASPSSVSGMLSLQEMSDTEFSRKKLIKHGNDLLDSLEQIRRRLLLGTMSMQALRDLNQQISKGKHEFSDPKLVEIIEDIELRAAVELAKLEMATKK